MGIRGGRGFVGETLWRPIAKAMALFVGLVSVSTAIGVGESWTKEHLEWLIKEQALR